LDAKKAHDFSGTKDLVQVGKHHRNLLSQMVSAMDIVVSARFLVINSPPNQRGMFSATHDSTLDSWNPISILLYM
jgi:hypothetical protein